MGKNGGWDTGARSGGRITFQEGSGGIRAKVDRANPGGAEKLVERLQAVRFAPGGEIVQAPVVTMPMKQPASVFTAGPRR